MTARRYATSHAWKQAIEESLRKATATGPAFARRRQVLVYHRFLARVVAAFGEAVTLKGGLVLECRSPRARFTQDVDLCMVGPPGDMFTRLQAAGILDLSDHMVFDVRPDAVHPEIKIEGMKHVGLRFRVTCMLAEKIYGRPFGVDVVFGEPTFGKPDAVVVKDLLAFAGIPPPRLLLYPIESHLADKLHAYTMPRARPNSRVKDLPDMALLATIRPLEGKALRMVMDQSFAFRSTHQLPARFPDAPPSWGAVYDAMARDEQLAWPTLAEVTTAVRAFLDPVLAGSLDAEWVPAEWVWRARG
ncbi:MAG: nucleotidyl transferase AbiEii/AbiGii toxin family protein [Planctomycetota bacterium]|nr:nucleotidyl transferase AbiEii/AbiGii toxin family protein [Planctomycetota bacterium]